MRGRKPDPAAARRGTSHHGAKTAALAPIQCSGAISAREALALQPPQVLPHTKAVRELWQQIIQEVARHELRCGDLLTAESLAIAKYRQLQAGLFVKKYGIMIRGPHGPLKNPMLKEERDQALVADRLLQRLGLSPEARLRRNLIQVAGLSMLGVLRSELEAAVEADMAAVGLVEGCVIVDGET
jgi:phage terminase small subunit